MGCVFCATGQMGFVRHLRAGEIVAQVLHAQRIVRAENQPGVRNLVLMGMGEPLHNYENVMTALETITDPRGLNIGPGRISISTVGVVPGILRLARERRPYNLAVSLHGASEAERAALVPASRRWPLVELIEACRTYGAQTGRRIFFEWTLVAGVNDSPDTARRLAALLHGIDAHINLIPLNPTAASSGHPPMEQPPTRSNSSCRTPGILARFASVAGSTWRGVRAIAGGEEGADVVASRVSGVPTSVRMALRAGPYFPLANHPNGNRFPENPGTGSESHPYTGWMTGSSRCLFKPAAL